MHRKLALCREGRKNVTFEVVIINGIVGAVLDSCSFGCRQDVREEFECERFVIRLVGFVLRKVCDNMRKVCDNSGAVLDTTCETLTSILHPLNSEI